MWEILPSAVRARVGSVLPEPAGDARLAVVLAAASRQVGVTEHLGADGAHQPVGYCVYKPKIVAAIVSL